MVYPPNSMEMEKTRFLKTTYARESKRNEVTSIPYGLMDQITEVTCMKQSLAPLIIPQHQDKGPHLDIWNCNGLLRHDHSSHSSRSVKTPANSIIAPPNNSGLPTPFSEHFEASSTTNTIITGHVTQSRILPLYVDNFKTWHFHAGAVYNTGKGDFQARSYLRVTTLPDK
ncbi:hypothetical protein J6590_006929 [Homalodisca vitripennis]|nr:hypothetical protein J6590_006929 [Homalodisca vitripennis]